MTTLAEDFEAVASAHEQSITHAVIGEMGWRDGDERHAPGLARRGEVLTWDEARPLLDYYYNAGYGAPDCQAMIAPRPYQDWIDLDLALLARCDGLVRLPGASVGAYAEVAWCDEHGVPVHRLPLAWGSTTTLVQLRSWLDGLAVGTEVER